MPPKLEGNSPDPHLWGSIGQCGPGRARGDRDRLNDAQYHTVRLEEEPAHPSGSSGLAVLSRG
eukprot:6759686-Pyramimonas_sp.AAC.1